MYTEALEYLKTIVNPLTSGGVVLIQDKENPGAICIIPRSMRDYAGLVGVKGKNADVIRHLFRMWFAAKGIAYDRINLMVANPDLIQTESV